MSNSQITYIRSAPTTVFILYNYIPSHRTDKTHTKHLHVSQTISHSRDPAEHRCIKTTAASYSKPIVPIFHPIVNILTKNSGPVISYHIAISEGSHKIV